MSDQTTVMLYINCIHSPGGAERVFCQLANRFVKHPSDVVKVGDVVRVWVLSVDLKKKRIALTMKKPA